MVAGKSEHEDKRWIQQRTRSSIQSGRVYDRLYTETGAKRKIRINEFITFTPKVGIRRCIPIPNSVS
jgi:hypothetical protein